MVFYSPVSSSFMREKTPNTYFICIYWIYIYLFLNSAFLILIREFRNLFSLLDFDNIFFFLDFSFLKAFWYDYRIFLVFVEECNNNFVSLCIDCSIKFLFISSKVLLGKYIFFCIIIIYWSSNRWLKWCWKWKLIAPQSLKLQFCSFVVLLDTHIYACINRFSFASFLFIIE